MKINDAIFGCFFQVGFDPNLHEQDFLELANIFRDYVWGERGICNIIEELKYDNYGNDLKLILFEFYVKPTANEINNIKEIESYRKKEKSIGIPIIINDENFFAKDEDGRRSFLKQSVLLKLDILAEVVKKKKLDTNIDLLKANLNCAFS